MFREERNVGNNRTKAIDIKNPLLHNNQHFDIITCFQQEVGGEMDGHPEQPRREDANAGARNWGN